MITKAVVSLSVVRDFEREARRAFPREAFGYLLGQAAGDLVTVEDLYLSDSRRNTKDAVYTTPAFEGEAVAHALDEGLEIVGSIHSHPYHHEPGQIVDCSPSEFDFDRGWLGIYGISLVTQTRGGRLRARTRFYPPAPPLDVIYEHENHAQE